MSYTPKPRRPVFKRVLDYVVVRPIHLRNQGIVIEPGDENYPQTCRLFRKRNLHNRNLIGPIGHPWTEYMLERYGKKVAKVEEEVTTITDSDDSDSTDDEDQTSTDDQEDITDEEDDVDDEENLEDQD